MKILYFGTVCNIAEYEKMLSGCKNRPSVASIVYETSLLSGMKVNGAEIEIYSFPMIPTFPKSKRLYWGNKKETLQCGYDCTWLKTVNIPFIKQTSRNLNGRKILKKWIMENKGSECAVLTYSIPPFLAKDIVEICHKNGVKCFALITDLLKYMYMNHKSNPLVSKLKNMYLSDAVKYQGRFDGYIYLTEAMKEVINPHKPYTIVEGIANIDDFMSVPTCEKATPKAVMYAGRLNEKYGILDLVSAFRSLEDENISLWLFGNGNCVDKIKECCKEDKRIKYFGNVSREEVLKYQRQAALLVNIRKDNDEYTKYSFPSKTIEYMASGTPLLTGVLPGIPKEYYNYTFWIDKFDTGSISKKLKEILCLPQKSLEAKGMEARRFIFEKKNSEYQSKNILQFIEHNIKR